MRPRGGGPPLAFLGGPPRVPPPPLALQIQAWYELKQEMEEEEEETRTNLNDLEELSVSHLARQVSCRGCPGFANAGKKLEKEAKSSPPNHREQATSPV